MDSAHRDPPIKDPKRIDVNDPRECQAWAVLFQLSEDDLRKAVEVVGPMSAAVSVYINSRGRRGKARQTGEIGQPFDRTPSSRVAGSRDDEPRDH